MSLLDRVLKFVNENHEPIKIAGSVVVAAFVLFEYLDRQDQARVKRTLEHVKDFRSSTLPRKTDADYTYWINGTERQALTNRAEAIITHAGSEAGSRVSVVAAEPTGRDDVVPDEKPIALEESKERRIRYLQYKKRISVDPDLFKYVHSTQTFYFHAAQCALNEQCDLQTMCDVFAPNMQAFYNLHKQYFDDYQDDFLINRNPEICEFIQKCESIKLESYLVSLRYSRNTTDNACSEYNDTDLN